MRRSGSRGEGPGGGPGGGPGRGGPAAGDSLAGRRRADWALTSSEACESRLPPRGSSRERRSDLHGSRTALAPRDGPKSAGRARAARTARTESGSDGASPSRLQGCAGSGAHPTSGPASPSPHGRPVHPPGTARPFFRPIGRTPGRPGQVISGDGVPHHHPPRCHAPPCAPSAEGGAVFGSRSRLPAAPQADHSPARIRPAGPQAPTAKDTVNPAAAARAAATCPAPPPRGASTAAAGG